MKFKRLKRRLQLPTYVVAGLLEMLWIATQKNAPRGDIGRFDNEAIAVEMDWDGDADELINVLVETGWLDQDATFRLLVHDWPTHAPRYIHGIVARSDGFAMPTTVDELPTNSESLQSATTVGDNTEQQRNVTKPNVTKRNQTKPSTDDSVEVSGDDSEVIREVFEHYRKYHPRAHPKPQSNSKEWKLIKARLKEGHSVEDLKLAIDGCHRSAWHQGENDRATKYDTLELIVRDSSKVAQFMELANGPTGTKPNRESERLKSTFSLLDRLADADRFQPVPQTAGDS